MGRVSNDSVSTTYVVPCDTGAACHLWWRDIYLKLTCSLSSTHTVSETATPLGHRKRENSKWEKVCCVKKRVACLASLVGLCLACTSCIWAFDCPLCSLVVWSPAFSALGDIHLLDLTFIPVPLVLPPPLECVLDVALPVTPTSCCVRLRGKHCRGLEKVFHGSRVLTEPTLALVLRIHPNRYRCMCVR